jgi:hypothetical protein
MKLSKINRTMFLRSEVVCVQWEKNVLVIGLRSSHTLRIDDKSDAERLWKLLGGDGPDSDEKPPRPGAWKAK